jgi:hypothetical protein
MRQNRIAAISYRVAAAASKQQGWRRRDIFFEFSSGKQACAGTARYWLIQNCGNFASLMSGIEAYLAALNRNRNSRQLSGGI